MKEIPLLFTGEMVRAILVGTKVVTRRPVRPPRKGLHLGVYSPPHEYVWVDDDGDPVDVEVCCPYGEPGDVLWVRETWRRSSDSVLHYRASDDGKLPSNERWRPSIHMPRSVCRLLLRRTERATIETVEDTSDEEARREGFASGDELLTWWRHRYPGEQWCWRIPFVRFVEWVLPINL